MRIQHPTSTKPITNTIGYLLLVSLYLLLNPELSISQVPQCNFPYMTDGSYGDYQSRDVALGDFDGDGDLDAWVVNDNNQPNQIWINQGGLQRGVPGFYTNSGQNLGTSSSHSVALGDVDGDGDLDAWVANLVTNFLWINQGGSQLGELGIFVNSGQFLGSSSSYEVALGDIDGDGDLDAWVANYNNQPNRLWINQGGVQGGNLGTFTDSGQLLGNSQSYSVSLGDLDGDGDLDAFVGNFNGQANRVWINQGGEQGGTPGVYADSGQALGNSSSFGVGLADFDDDGDLDAWVANWNGSASVWINQSGSQGSTTNGTFVLSTMNFGQAYGRDIAIADLDGDGDLDAFSINGDGCQIWNNQAGIQGGIQGTFLSNGQQFSFDGHNAALGDLDGDGDIDAWLANGGPNRVLINQGIDQNGTPGIFVEYGQDIGFTSSYATSLGDLDGDGDLDALIAVDGQANRILINQGGIQSGSIGRFAYSNQSPLSDISNSWDVALGDLDNDGDLDAWVANWGANRILMNQGGIQGGAAGLGTLYDAGYDLGDSESKGVALGDIDSDGDLDAWVANRNGEANRIWINQGGEQGGTPGVYADSGQTLGNFDSHDVALGDFDEDGDIDAWVANRNGEPNRLWINQGNDQGGIIGLYIDSGQEFGNSDSNAIALGDIDEDGDLDVFVTNSNQFDRIWINQGGVQLGISGTFVASDQILDDLDSRSVSLEDFDGDGDLDALIVNYGQPNKLWLNQGGIQNGTIGNYEDSGQSLGQFYSRDVSIGDLDGDGDPDAIVANYGNQQDRVWINLISCFNDDDGDGIPNECDSDLILGPDCDGNGEVDTCQTDTDSDGTIDPCDDDVDDDGILNDCDVDFGGEDCNTNGIIDTCDIAAGVAVDCDGDQIPDSCEITLGTELDCNFNAIPDSCDIAAGTVFDCDSDGVPDECKGGVTFDCNSNGIPDECDFVNGTSFDCNGNGFLDDCDILNGFAEDCDLNGIPDECESDSDSDNDGTIDPCDDDLDGDGFPNDCDIDQTGGDDCDLNGQDDSCQTDTDSDGTIDPCDIDADGDGILNECDPDHASGEDCNSNGILDSCDIAGGAADANTNGIPDECEETPFIRGDVNGDGGVDISDAITTLDYLFTGGSITCDKAADSNDDAAINVADAIQLLGYLFSGTGDLPAPFPTCGVDPTLDNLECESYNGC